MSGHHFSISRRDRITQRFSIGHFRFLCFMVCLRQIDHSLVAASANMPLPGGRLFRANSPLPSSASVREARVCCNSGGKFVCLPPRGCPSWNSLKRFNSDSRELGAFVASVCWRADVADRSADKRDSLRVCWEKSKSAFKCSRAGEKYGGLRGGCQSVACSEPVGAPRADRHLRQFFTRRMLPTYSADDDDDDERNNFVTHSPPPK